MSPCHDLGWFGVGERLTTTLFITHTFLCFLDVNDQCVVINSFLLVLAAALWAPRQKKELISKLDSSDSGRCRIGRFRFTWLLESRATSRRCKMQGQRTEAQPKRSLLAQNKRSKRVNALSFMRAQAGREMKLWSGDACV